MHQHCVGADGLDLLPRNGQVLFPAQQAEQPGPPQQDQALQTGGGGIKGQIIGPAQAHPLLQLHNFLFTKFPDGHSTSPLSATSLCGPGRVHAKSGGKAPPGCGILELFPNNSE